MSQASRGLRRKLGESLPSLQKYDMPLQATTTSLEALQAYSLASRMAGQKGIVATMPLLLRAVELDPNFAMAYTSLARRYNNLNEPSLALQYAAKAYALRDRVTEREQLIVSHMYFRCIGDTERQKQLFAQWAAIYPRSAPSGSLGMDYYFLGEYQQALPDLETGLREDPDDVTNYDNLAGAYLALNRLPEAVAVLQQANARHISSGDLNATAYDLAFLQQDPLEMERQLSSATGMAGAEDVLLASQADTEAFYGRLQTARNFSSQAVNTATRADLPEVAGMWQALSALREAQFGENREAQRAAEKALEVSSGRNVKFFAAMALAFAGDTKRAQQLALELQSENASDSMLNKHRLPTLRAAIELSRKNPVEALVILEPARAYEFGQPSPVGYGTLFVPYLRGEAFLMNRDGASAAAEFHKILDHPGLALNFPVGVLAHLQLARAYVLLGDSKAARASYERFLGLWKDGDAEVRILKEAEGEYGRLH